MKKIKDYDNYFINEQGQVFKKNKDGLLVGRKSIKEKIGYLRITLSKNGINKKYLIHRLVAECFLEDYSEDLQVDHIDRNCLNNHVSNLRMVTGQQNQFNTNAKGYCWDKRSDKWRAYICINKKLKHLGYFKKEEEARDAYLKAKEIYHVV